MRSLSFSLVFRNVFSRRTEGAASHERIKEFLNSISCWPRLRGSFLFECKFEQECWSGGVWLSAGTRYEISSCEADSRDENVSDEPDQGKGRDRTIPLRIGTQQFHPLLHPRALQLTYHWPCPNELSTQVSLVILNTRTYAENQNTPCDLQQYSVLSSPLSRRH